MKQFVIVLIFSSLHLNAQYETINWNVAGGAILNFSTTPAIVSNTLPLGSNQIGTSLSDATGNLIVITNNGRIYNNQGQLVAPQIFSLSAPTGEQSGLVVPKPGSPGIYYVFFIGSNLSMGNLSYSLFEPALAGGAGSLTVMNHTVSSYPTANGLCAIKHCNGKDVWVVCGQDTNVTLSSYKIYSYLLTAAGINTVPVVSMVSNLSDPLTHGISYLRSSPDGRRLAIGSRQYYGFPLSYSLAISDFDRTTGTLSNTYLARVFNDAQAGASYFEFSPDGSKLYTVERPGNLVQLDLCSGNPSAVVASANTVVTLAASTYSFYRGIQRAINGQIYLTQWGSQGWHDSLAAIQQPNNAGSACDFSLNAQSVGTGTYAGYLPHYPHFLMKPLIAINQPNQACSKVSFTFPSSSTVCTAVSSLSSFYWDFGEPASATNTSSLYSPVHSYGSPGNYHVKLVLDDGQCVADTLHKQITVLPNPTLNISVSPLSQTLCPGQTATLTAFGASGYTWMPGVLSGAQVTVSPQSNTSYIVKGEDNNGCANSSTLSVSVINCTGLAGLRENKELFTVYPNPASEILNVELGTLNEVTARIEIFNSRGQIIYSEQNISSTNEKSRIYKLDLRDHLKGIYFIKITRGEQYAVKKLMLE